MSPPPGSAHINLAMAAVVSAGGFIGFARKRSVPSLLAGVAFGALYGYSGYLISENNCETGHDLATVTSLILAASMGRRALRGGKFMPGGLIASLAVVTGAYNGVKSYEYRYGL